MAIEQLVLSKYLFREGQKQVSARDPVSAGLAISLYQDAVELFLWTIAKEYEARATDKTSFTDMWDLIRDAKRNVERRELPLRAKMMELNKARVNFKHYGNLPAPSEAEKFQGYTEDFLRESMKLFFDVDFDDVSLVDLVKNEEVKQLLKEAERYLRENLAKESVLTCAKAENLISGYLSKLIPRVDHRLGDMARAFKDPEQRRAFQGPLRYLEDYLDTLRKLCIAGLFRFDVFDLSRFRKTVGPSVSRMADGSFQIVERREQYSLEDAKFVINYVINYAIAVQEHVNE